LGDPDAPNPNIEKARVQHPGGDLRSRNSGCRLIPATAALKRKRDMSTLSFLILISIIGTGWAVVIHAMMRPDDID
jgi:hypothetical protein